MNDIAMSIERLKEILSYDAVRGEFRWLVKIGKKVNVGSIAGSRCKQSGYENIKIDGKKYLSHRLAWLFSNGEWPPEEIDHINRVKYDNRLANLRLVTHAENSQNKAKQSNNTSGHKGISWDKGKEKWHARIMVNRKTKHLGYFACLPDAVAAYRDAALQLHTHYPNCIV